MPIEGQQSSLSLSLSQAQKMRELDTDATTITKRMVAELIDHIEVYHAEKQDGITNQRVVIHYNCIGAFDVPDRRKIRKPTLSWKQEKA